ncbi:maltose O-acetyltransferase [Austwickia chelonae NBRC 105200]|uniref:Maltose O-acetyltransferase n=2 Tax=Austwickia TaxID=1184606 RepID=K6WA98_9MICO|nr:maltose O-acetyltransferase [Austwickia chelonae NBRC 105200]
MDDGDLYQADDPELVEIRLRCADLQETYNATAERQEDLRVELLRALLDHCGQDVVIRPPLLLDYGINVSIGARSFVNYNLVALDVARITIGEDCFIGPNVQLLTPSHPLEPGLRRARWESGAPITLGDNVWLGGGVIVLPGVSIGDNTVVGSGAVVTKDLPANVVAVGNPARIVRHVEESDGHTPDDGAAPGA